MANRRGKMAPADRRYRGVRARPMGSGSGDVAVRGELYAKLRRGAEARGMTVAAFLDAALLAVLPPAP